MSNARKLGNMTTHGLDGDFNVDPTDNTLVVDSTNNRVGIGSATPTTTLDITGTATATAFAGPLTGNVTGTTSSISNHNTDALTEGSTNLYFTNARADARAQLKIDALVDSAPNTLDTLNELAAALGDDANFSTTVTNSIATKLPLAGGTLTGALIVDAGNSGLDVRVGTDKRVIWQGNIGEIGSVAGFQAVNTAGNANTAFGIRATDIRFATGSDERVRITDTGVGIGTNNPGSAKLDIRTTTIAAGSNFGTRGIKVQLPMVSGYQSQIASIISGFDSTINSTDIGMKYRGGGYDLTFSTNHTTSGVPTQHMVIDKIGNVGIGETNPGQKLHITNSTGSYIKHEGPSSGDYATGYQIFEGSTLSAAFYTNPSHDLTILSKDGMTFRLDNANRIKFTSTGNVGIGTTNPGQMLHISGSSPQIMLEDNDASGTPYSKISGVNGHIYLQADEGNNLADTAMHFRVDAQEHMILDDYGVLTIGGNYGTNAGWEGATSRPKLQVEQSDAYRGISLRVTGSTNVHPTLSLDRNLASGAQTTNGTKLGQVMFNGSGGGYVGRVAASITSEQFGSYTGGYVPGKLKFSTSNTTATHNGQSPSGSHAPRLTINPAGDFLIGSQFNYHVMSGTAQPNVAFAYDFYRDTYGHPMKITCAISHWNGGYMSYTEGFYWGYNTVMSSNVLHSYNGGNGSWTISFPTNNIVRVRMNGDASYAYGSGWYIKLEGNLRRTHTHA